MSHSHHDASFWTRSHPEPVVLDIGEDIGALILYTPSGLHGQEIEISPVGDDRSRVHTAILERSVNGRTVYAGVYAELRAGDYRLWGDSSVADRPQRVTIAAGAVAEVDWR
jgi:hypothetical protein